MKVNNIDISIFKAKLMERNIKSANFEVKNYWGNASLLPFINSNYKHQYKELTFTLDIVCLNACELETMKSNIIKQLEVSTINFDDIAYSYIGFCSEIPTTSYVMPGNEILSVKMLVYCCGTEKIETANRVASKTINVSGNIETPTIVEITPSIALVDLVVTGIGETFTIKNLTVGQKVIISGEDGTVLQNGVNKFGDYDSWDFPQLKPGANTITFSKNSCDVNIKYKPRYI
ncbi:phage distal tail protein [Clostridium sp. 'White wine YQ']|uniref:phage distal tail protein n=1 Tax=Clostridium sp. 'White wine YQ' TaxID=3027474 RepID=UPI002366A5EA|nr:phage tail domain-containing protein [Clostridium sp. 'White wine YQ']MDD7793700.1 phage tail family protein [Clostridium sp. 'White wine YQ']